MRQVSLILAGAGACLALAPSSPAQTFLGPTPYLSIDDTPFDLSGLGSTAFLDDFEDGQWNLPGAHVCSGEIITGGQFIDSVDGDDGVIDGLGTAGHSYFYVDGSVGIRVTFNADELGALPTFAGLVWTDGGFGCSITFEAFDEHGASLGTIVKDNAGDFSFSGTTAEDRFCGVKYDAGISAIRMLNNTNAIEIDHIQYGGLPPQDPPPECYPDCTGDGVLDLFDFLCFVNAFNAAKPYADCDLHPCTTFDLFDFLCYTNAFNTGC
jgi:hypothetical protein